VLAALAEPERSHATEPEASPPPPPLVLVSVVDADGAALAGASVMVLRPEGWTERGRTDERGALEVAIQPDELGLNTATSEFAWIKAEAEGRATLLESAVDVRSGHPARVELGLGAVGATLSGRAVDRDGFPVPDARVLVLPTNLPTGKVSEGAVYRAVRHLGRTDGEGAFSFAGIAPGSVHVYFEHPELGIDDVQANLAPDGAQLDLRFEPGFRLRGIVRDASGAPAVGAKVWTIGSAIAALPVDWTTAKTDAEGRFELSARADQRLQLWALAAGSHTEYASQIVEARAGGELEWTAALREWLPVRIRLVDRAGAPMHDWMVRLRPMAEGDLRWTISRTDERGLAELILPVEGPLRAEVLGPFPGNTRSVFASAIDLSASFDVREIAVDPAPGAKVALKARFAPRGFELPADFVAVLDPGERDRATRLALGPGATLQVDDLVPGTYWLYGEGAQALITEVRSVEIAPGGAADLGAFELDPPGRLDLSRLPADQLVQVWRDAEDGGPRFRWSGKRSEAESLSLLPGRYVLRRVGAPEVGFEMPSGGLVEVGADFSVR
jgi:hypothetical protein